MSECVAVPGNCGCRGERQVIDLFTPLYHAHGGVLYRIQIMVKAKAVEMGDGGDVETRINTLERNLAGNTTTRFADTIAGRDAIIGLVPGDRCYVFDASADPDVEKGPAMYLWLPALKWQLQYKCLSPCDAANMILKNGGLKVTDCNKLYVDLSDVGEEIRRGILENLVVDGSGLKLDADGRLVFDPAGLVAAKGGLMVDKNGKVYVDFSQVPAAEQKIFITELIENIINKDGDVILGSDGTLTLNLAKIAGKGLTVSGGKLNVDTSVFGGLFGSDSSGNPVLNLSAIAGNGLWVVSDKLAAKVGAGLKVTAANGIELDLGTAASAAKLGDLILAGGGLAVDANGKLYVDFDAMGTERFEKIVSALHLTLWAGENGKYLDWYVNGATGSDTVNEGRGQSANKPFKTIQACVNYVTANINVNSRAVTIHVAKGSYPERLTLGEFAVSTGSITIEGESWANAFTLNPTLSASSVPRVVYCQGAWDIRNFKVNVAVPALVATSGQGMILGSTGGGVLRVGRHSLTVNLEGETSRPLMFYHAAGGQITLLAANDGPSSAALTRETAASAVSVVCAYASTNGYISFGGSNAADVSGQISLSGDFNLIAEASGGKMVVQSGYNEFARFVQANSTAQAYKCDNGGTIQAGLADFFPGTLPAAATIGNFVEASTYSWYKPAFAG